APGLAVALENFQVEAGDLAIVLIEVGGRGGGHRHPDDILRWLRGTPRHHGQGNPQQDHEPAHAVLLDWCVIRPPYSEGKPCDATACQSRRRLGYPSPELTASSGLTMTSTIVGGGAKKILHTLANVRRMGLRNSAKALNSKNTCKACGLGMGGQLGGMTDEAGDFPSVCNKSIQAQSTDIQAPIPMAFLRHSLVESGELTGRVLEHLGRLDTPLSKPPDSTHFRPMRWDEAIALAAARFASVAPARSFFYSSG